MSPFSLLIRVYEGYDRTSVVKNVKEVGRSNMQEKVFNNLREQPLQNMRVAILVTDDLEQVEMTSPKDLGAFNPAMIELFAEHRSLVSR
jgi:hypothetical protein